MNNFKNSSVDHIVFKRMQLNQSTPSIINKNLNPLIFDLSDLKSFCVYDEEENFVYPPTLRLSQEELADVPLSLVDDGFALYLYVLKLFKKFGRSPKG